MYVCCAACQDSPRRNSDSMEEVLFQAHGGHLFSKFGFTIEKTSQDEADCVDDCCNDCENCCCCDEGPGITTSTKVATVTRGGFAESLGVQVGWGLEKVGEISVHDLKVPTIRQIMQMAQPPVVLTFMLPRGAKQRNSETNPVQEQYTPPQLEFSRHDNRDQVEPLVRPD